MTDVQKAVATAVPSTLVAQALKSHFSLGQALGIAILAAEGALEAIGNPASIPTDILTVVQGVTSILFPTSTVPTSTTPPAA